MKMNEKKSKLLESCLVFNEKHTIASIMVHQTQTGLISQKINVSATITNLRKRLKMAETKADCDKVKALCQKNINGFKRYWERNTKSKLKAVSKAKEETFNKAITTMEDLMKQCDEKKKTLNK